MLSLFPAMALFSLTFALPAAVIFEETNVNFTLAARDTAAQASSFHFREYRYSHTCDHGAPAGDTDPPNNQGPALGQTGFCYNSLPGYAQSLEFDQRVQNIYVFCNTGCSGNGYQITQGSSGPGQTCFYPPSGCAIGSFGVL